MAVDCIWSILLIWIAVVDYRRKKISDVFMIPGLMCGWIRIFFQETHSFTEGVAALFISTVIFFVILLAAPGAFGGGDIKLSGVIGFYLGIELWMKSFVAAIFSGGIYAVYLIIKKKENRKQEIAFGPFLCFGALVVMWYF